MQTPSPSHEKFDQLCEPVDEFEYLPVHPTSPAEFDPAPDVDTEKRALDEQILTGLVCPV